MTHTTLTSRLALPNVNKDGWYTRIKKVMREGEWCIADISAVLKAEKSTVSARLNEMRLLGMIEETTKKRSSTTGILANHYRLAGKVETLKLI